MEDTNNIPNEEQTGRLQQPAVRCLLPPGVTVDDLARIRNYFRDNDRTPFEHHAYTVMNRLLRSAMFHGGNNT